MCIRDSYTNHTDKTISSRQYCMLAYDKEGQPLKLQWYIMDSGDKPSYDCLYDDHAVSYTHLDVYKRQP